MHMTLFETGGLFALAQVLMIDVMLAGASGSPERSEERRPCDKNKKSQPCI